jgi:hypothetical protein
MQGSVLTALSLVLFAQLTPAQCVTYVERDLDPAARVLDALAQSPAAITELERVKDPYAKVKTMVKPQVDRICAKPPAVLAAYEAWTPEEDEDFPRQKELDAWLDGAVRPVIDQLTALDRELNALSNDALCDRAMGVVGPVMLTVSEPLGDAAHAFWNKHWKRADVARFFAQACKAEKVAATRREALLCYAKIRS